MSIDRFYDYSMGAVFTLLAGVAFAFGVSVVYELLRELGVL